MSELEKEQQEVISQALSQDANVVFDENKPPPTTSETSRAKHNGRTSTSSKSPEELARQVEVDSRSIFVGNVDYSSTPDELEEFFHDCGVINRVTILFNKYTGMPKGYAYVEFEEKNAVATAVEKLNGGQFKGRTISVAEKRTNLPGLAQRRGGRGGNRGRGGPRSSRGKRRESSGALETKLGDLSL